MCAYYTGTLKEKCSFHTFSHILEVLHSLDILLSRQELWTLYCAQNVGRGREGEMGEEEGREA